MASIKRRCAVDECSQDQFKNNYCIDHWREHSGVSTKSGQINHAHLNTFGKAKLNSDQECDRINQQFLNDKQYDVDEAKLLEYKSKFQEMDENGSGDIDIHELGRAMERLGKPKNQLQLKKMIAEVDLTNTGTIKYNEFLQMMLGKSSSVLRLILMYEGMAKKEEEAKQKPKGAPVKKNISQLP